MANWSGFTRLLQNIKALLQSRPSKSASYLLLSQILNGINTNANSPSRNCRVINLEKFTKTHRKLFALYGGVSVALTPNWLNKFGNKFYAQHVIKFKRSPNGIKNKKKTAKKSHTLFCARFNTVYMTTNSSTAGWLQCLTLCVNNSHSHNSYFQPAHTRLVTFSVQRN